MTDLTVAPLNPDRWTDLMTLFGPDRGAYGRCWCMLWRVTGRQFDALGGDGRRSAFRDRIVAQDSPPAGVASRLIEAAVELAATDDAAAVEAYPVDVDGDVADRAIDTGTVDVFTDAGFAEIARRRHRPIVRRHLSS